MAEILNFKKGKEDREMSLMLTLSNGIWKEHETVLRDMSIERYSFVIGCLLFFLKIRIGEDSYKKVKIVEGVLKSLYEADEVKIYNSYENYINILAYLEYQKSPIRDELDEISFAKGFLSASIPFIMESDKALKVLCRKFDNLFI